MKSYTYLIINLSCFIIPFLVSFYPKKPFIKDWKYFFPVNLFVATLFIIWDYLFTNMGVWGFNPDYLTGIYLRNLPLEEVLFFICIPYSCTFTYFSLKHLVKKNPLEKYQSGITWTLIIVTGSLGILYINRWYTSITFISVVLFLTYTMIKDISMSYTYLTYFSILPFFMISNGLLTGSCLDAPIVWYNNDYNLNIRLLTIPIEDTIYGFLLIALNIQLTYYYLKRK